MYKIGTAKEAKRLIGKIPKKVCIEACNIANTLDRIYGANRDIYRSDGGFIFIAENLSDLDYFIKNHINPADRSFEDVQIFKTERGDYFNIFFLCNNEFSINLLMPLSLMPELSSEASIRK
ncbi:MAG: hypothetical protein IJ587_01110 [Synergistaceae bacterium]|nr:hypothetical protein [Synergistaceae bacterium]